MAAIAVGTEAPDFTLDGANLQSKFTLSAYRGKRDVALMFFPLAFTGVCSKEAGACETDYVDYADKDVLLVMISVDSQPTQMAFAEKMGIKSLPILADFHPKGEVGRKYGVYLEDKGIHARATVVVGKDGRVKWVKVNELGVQRVNGEILGAAQGARKASA